MHNISVRLSIVSVSIFNLSFVPVNKKAFVDFNYEAACSPAILAAEEITAVEMYLLPPKSFQLVDVRNREEQPKAANDELINIRIYLAILKKYTV